LGVLACGRSARRPQEVLTPAVLSSPCPRRCPVRASGVPRVPVQVIGVRCPVRVSERPGVQCPASGVRCGVRCPCLPASAVSDRDEVVQRGSGQAATRLGWPGSACRPPCPRRRVVCPRLEPGARGWRRPCWASGGSASTWSSSWVVVGSGPFDRVADRRGWMQGSPVGRQLAVTTLRGHCVRPRAESPRLSEPSRLDCDLRLRPRRGRNMQ
jgi:hypothetical protein